MKRMLTILTAIAALTVGALLGLRFVDHAGSPQIERRVEIGDMSFIRLEGQSTVADMLRNHDVVVGRVTGSENVSDGTVPHRGTPAKPWDGPRYDPEKSPPFTSGYDVELIEVIDSKTGLAAGQSIRLLQPGGLWKGTAYEFKGDPIIEVGKTYLFFLRKNADNGFDFYGATMWGRFTVGEDGRLQPVSSEWDSLEPVQALRGLQIAEAKIKIANSRR